MATTTSHNKKSSAVKRILSEARELKEPTVEYAAYPLDDNIFEWHFTLRGPSQSEFEEGMYHGRILLPAEYPFRPPDVMIMTPNGRWELNKKICLTFTGFHEEMWQPAWGIRTALIGVQAFMGARAEAAVGIGSLDFPIAERERLAKISGDWKCPKCNVSNRETLPDVGRNSRIQETLPEGLTVDPTGGKNNEKVAEASASNDVKDSQTNDLQNYLHVPSNTSEKSEQQNSFEYSQGPTSEMLERIVRSGVDESQLLPSISSSQVSTPGRLTPQPGSATSSHFVAKSKGKERERPNGESNQFDSHNITGNQNTSSSISQITSNDQPSRPIPPTIDRQNSQPLPLPSLSRIRFARMAVRAGASSAEASARRLAALDRAIVTVICLLTALILRRILNAWP